ncbi:MAG: prepilin-type N-terminal cleavage/methylation domain-containing protein [Acidimicrobiia bacterium]
MISIRRARARLSRSTTCERGFTLPELLIVVAIGSGIALAIAAAFVVGAKTTAEAHTRLSESRDARLLATYFGGDAGSVAPNGISTADPPDNEPCWTAPLASHGTGPTLRLPGTTVVRMHWTEGGKARVAWYVQPDSQQPDGSWAPSSYLIRRLCEDDAGGISRVLEEVRVVKNLARAVPFCPPTGSCAGSPTRVDLEIEERSGYKYFLRALPRSTTAAQIVAALPPNVVSMNRVGPELTNASSVKWEVRFNDEVTGVSAADFNVAHTLGGGNPAVSVSPGFSTRRTNLWTVTVTTSTSQTTGTLRLDLFDNDQSIRDEDGVRLEDATVTGHTYQIDKVAPTVLLTRAAGQGAATNDLPIRLTARLSEPLAFDSTDVSCTGCGAGSIDVHGTSPTYEIVIDGIDAGEIDVSIPADAVKDAAGNGNPASAVVSVEYDPALLVVASIDRHTSDPDPANATVTSLRWVVTFSAAVRNVDASDFDLYDTMNGNAAISAATISAVTSSGTSPSTTWTVTANISGLSKAGDLWLELDDNDSIRAGAGPGGSRLGGTGEDNGNFTSHGYRVDRELPRPTITLPTGQAGSTKALPLRFTITFNEPVTGFDGSDITRGGEAVGGNMEVVANGDRAYDVVLDGVAVGDSTISVAANRAEDAVGHGNVASNLGTIHYDPSLLQVLSINPLDPVNTEADTVRWEVKFSESVRDVNLSGSGSDFVLVPNGLSGTPTLASIAPTSGTASVWTVTANLSAITGTGTLRLDLADNDTIHNTTDRLLGGPGNGNGNFAGQGYTVDRSPPAITSVQLRNGVGGIDGKLERGDQIVVTFSRRMRVSSFCDDWTDNSANQRLDGDNNVRVDVDNNDSWFGDDGDEEIRVSASSCAFNFGTIDMNDNDYVSNDRNFRGSGTNQSIVEWDATNFRLTMTLGGASGGTNVESDSHAPRYSADSDIRSSIGSTLNPSSFTLPNGVQF